MQNTIPTQSFNGLTEQLNMSVKEFEREATPENLARIVSALGAYASFGSGLAQSGLKYIKQNPVRSAMGLGVIFFALRGLAMIPPESTKPQLTH